MIKADGKVPRLKETLMTDAVSTCTGAALGTSTLTVFEENAAGINEGGRSGLTAATTAVCFLLALFLAPLFLAIPAMATAPVLILVGMMMHAVQQLNFDNYAETIPAFICIFVMPLCYSISDGIVLGHLSYVFINLLSGNRKKLNIGMYILAALFMLKYTL